MFARIALQSVVTLWPWLFVSVWGGGSEHRGCGECGADALERARGAHLEAVEDTVRAKELAGATKDPLLIRRCEESLLEEDHNAALN